MEIKIADRSHINAVLYFFARYISSDNDGVQGPELLCPDGVRAAIQRGQVLIAVEEKCLVAALRFYKRKTKNCISLYQFAIDEGFRGQGLLKEMLDMFDESVIEVLCPARSSFNTYYGNTGWMLLETGAKFNRWGFSSLDSLQSPKAFFSPSMIE